MSEILETVKIVAEHPSQGEFIEINKSDYDEKKHKLFKGKSADPKPSEGDELIVSETALKILTDAGLNPEDLQTSGTITVKMAKKFAADAGNSEPEGDDEGESEPADEQPAGDMPPPPPPAA